MDNEVNLTSELVSVLPTVKWVVPEFLNNPGNEEILEPSHS